MIKQDTTKTLITTTVNGTTTNRKPDCHLNDPESPTKMFLFKDISLPNDLLRSCKKFNKYRYQWYHNQYKN